MKLNKTTKKATGFIRQYLNAAGITTLDQCYGKYSNKKYVTFEYIKREMKKENGDDLRIMSHNCNYYSCAYKLNNNLIVHTYANKYIIENVF